MPITPVLGRVNIEQSPTFKDDGLVLGYVIFAFTVGVCAHEPADKLNYGHLKRGKIRVKTRLDKIFLCPIEDVYEATDQEKLDYAKG